MKIDEKMLTKFEWDCIENLCDKIICKEELDKYDIEQATILLSKIKFIREIIKRGKNEV